MFSKRAYTCLLKSEQILIKCDSRIVVFHLRYFTSILDYYENIKHFIRYLPIEMEHLERKGPVSVVETSHYNTLFYLLYNSISGVSVL